MTNWDWSHFDPAWTDKEYGKGGARDDLGIETLSESILADLLPGINNGTRRARYYSFLAWALYRFIQDPEIKPHNQSKFWEWLRSREDAFILAYLSHGCQSGLAGTEQALPVWGNGDQKVYPLDWKSLLSVDGGAYQLYYRGALEEMNIIVRSENSPHDDLSSPIGSSLAEAYETAVSKTRYVKKFFDATKLALPEIQQFAETGCICQVGQNEGERLQLIEAFFRYDTPDAFAVKRLASLCFFLDVIQQSKGYSLTNDDFRSVMYYWSFGKDHLYEPKGNLLQPAERWRNLQLRQYFVYFVEAFWSLFLDRIQTEALSAPEYMEWLSNNLNLRLLSQQWGLDLPKKKLSQISLQEFYTAVHRGLPKQAWQNGSASLRRRLNEQALMFTIKSARRDPEVNAFAGSALIGLAMLYWRSQTWTASSGWHYHSEKYSFGRLPFEGYVRRVDRALTEDWSLIKWLGHLHQNDLWLQHRKVALDKLINRRQEVYKFERIMDEADNPTADIQPRYRGLGTDVPKMNALRFPSALNILLDLSIIKMNDDTYKLTPDGKRLLEKFRAYKVPQWKEPQDVQIVEHTEEN